MSDDPKTQDQVHSDEHPLASPTELAGSTEGALAAEFAARDAEEAVDAADAVDADAAGAASGIAYQDGTLDRE